MVGSDWLVAMLKVRGVGAVRSDPKKSNDIKEQPIVGLLRKFVRSVRCSKGTRLKKFWVKSATFCVHFTSMEELTQSGRDRVHNIFESPALPSQ